MGFGPALLYPGDRGGYLNLHAWRRDEWYPALESAGLPRLVPYSMRHSFASFSIAAGVSLFYLARLMGSSVEQIDKTYEHLLPDSEEYLRGLLDTYDVNNTVPSGRRRSTMSTISTTREHVVIVAPTVERVSHVTAESRERAVELIAVVRRSATGRRSFHVLDKEHGYEIVDSWPTPDDEL